MAGEGSSQPDPFHSSDLMEAGSRGGFSTTMDYSDSFGSWGEDLDLQRQSDIVEIEEQEKPAVRGLLDLHVGPTKKRRGRRPLRPLDPVRKKTEEKDKYWLRAFRAYMRTAYPSLKDRMSPEDQNFWNLYLSPTGKPGKGGQFSSYGKAYKSFLFSQATYMRCFRRWFTEHGETELSKKCSRSTDLWFVFYDYASKDLYGHPDYREDPLASIESPLFCAQEEMQDPIDALLLSMEIDIKEEDGLDVLADGKMTL